MKKLKGKRKLGRNSPTIQEDNENEIEMNSVETEEEDDDGDRNRNWGQQEINISLDTKNENNGNVESGGDERTNIEELEGFAEGDCMELREEHRK